jgi:hypothetical protein
MLEPFTQAELRAALEYDPTQGWFLWRMPPKQHPDLRGKQAGRATDSGNGKSYIAIQFKGRKYKRSRLAFFWMVGRWPEHQIDHINGNSVDDRWANLREATPTQNAWNHKTRARRIDLPMGVRRSVGGKYVARIAQNGVQHTIGTFATIEEAKAAYQQERSVRYGEFA